MFKKIFSKKKDGIRVLETPNQLEVGDIVEFKYRESLPTSLREKHLEVSKIGTYEYASGTSKEIVLKDENNHNYFMSLEDDNGDVYLCLAKKISRQQVHRLFDEQVFSQLWTDEWVQLKIQEHPESLTGWLADSYSQTIKEQQAYYYARNCYDRNGLVEDLSEADDGEELRFHECEGDDDHYGLNIEISDDGSTEVFLQVFCPTDVIADMWPHVH